MIKNKKIHMPTGKNMIFLFIYIFSFLVVEFYAVDKGMNLLAFFKNLVIILFVVTFLQFDNEGLEEKKRHLNVIPYSACFNVLLSLLLITVPNSGMYHKNRFQGLFQYANSYGLFLLIGVFVLLQKEKYTWKDYVIFVTLFIGIVLTNSRAIIILTVLAMVISIFFHKEYWKRTLAVIACFMALFGGIYLFSNIEKRVNKDMLESSEMTTRILYYTDATRMILKNPFGYGYEGWYYGQVAEKTGVYDSKYVHNSVLQVLLDVGVIPTLALCIMLILAFFDKHQDAFSRIIILLILVHSLIDIDLEYIYFVLLLTLMIDFGQKEIKMNHYASNCLVGIISMLGVWYFIIFLSDINYASKNYIAAVKILPFHTEALQEVLYSVTDKSEQIKYANQVLKYNKIVSGAYEALSNEAQEKNNYMKALEYEDERLKLNKYNIYNYMVYAEFLSRGIKYYSEQHQNEELQLFLIKAGSIETTIAEVLEKTNPLCYKTIHVPELEIPEELQRFIEKARMMKKTAQKGRPFSCELVT